MKIVIISVTSRGNRIANDISKIISTDKFLKDDVKNLGIKNIVERYFKKQNTIIFIASTGIAIRAIAPYIHSKDKDPAVLVIDSTCKFVISLLSGHLGGANKMTLEIASIISAEPIITTATDNMGIVAPDIIAKENNYVIDDLKRAKEISAMLVDNKRVAYIEEYFGRNSKVNEVPKGYVSTINNADGLVIVTNKYNLDFNKTYLKLINKNIVLGIGCKRGISAEYMKEKIFKILKVYNIDKRAVKIISTVEIKKNEKAILHMVDEFKCDFRTFTINDLKKVEDNYEGSDFVKSVIGVRAVAEPSVELVGAVPITKKLKLNGITLCIGILK
ncbi:cobalt-precorrin 5A hydrolase [Clostridium botulinum]|uniref:Cobalamin biosynthesis protein CbiG n=1 Tax=Clostridium botulinum C/D str. DC5 TaxID=1443128 RepID=A0A0A0IDB2_CLOBO|nr:cobalt-precorrin 5A hydrolase [Clostridium botulinum]KEI00347.1 cobalamin biosynthesis protein CbiG [Clostridium botulinum C/D str. BKT75002]KEI08968.1 cobalamin biosynthesis protein CbiG [Clostridium botulinum C/D str. BKT2873]KGM95985.1 cobalamin biosynthesis protein CbiG [Clostridium botulinum D str. CCUG 7971]KGM99439.1 cobalamin biosynthesis protein CbiG [Clostridium botulinum C/D str. DC5]KOC49063.1 cobalamin biosynthesis protein CbiG [Clostridium botulinum]